MNAHSSPSPSLVVSVVSHGHGPLAQALLHDLARLSAATVARVVLTQNLPEALPEAPSAGWPFVLQVISNQVPAGFGANHNQALANAPEPFVCVLNPDVTLPAQDPLAALVRASALPGAGCAYPVQLDGHGKVQDSERELPTPLALWRRHVLQKKEERVDWVNAACLVLPSAVWQSLGGFDERYFMYCEDVDLCLRLHQARWALVPVPVEVEHAGQRASHRRWNHLRWHVTSLLRLWRSPAYRWANERLLAGNELAQNLGHP